MEGPFVELRGVSRDYAKVQALKDLTLSIGPGICYGLIGPNGAGKSTLLRLMMGMLRPDTGTIRLFGGDPIRDAERVKLHVGYLAEDQAFPPSLRPSDLFDFFSDCYPTWDWDFAHDLVARFRIPIGRALSQLSKGEQRQAGLVCAVAHRPKLLILDEPGGGLDPLVRRRFLEEVVDLLSTAESSVILSSHNMEEVERMATRIGILHRGSLILDQELDRLKEASCRVLAEGIEVDVERERVSLPGCVQARRRGDAWALTFLCGEIEAKERVGRQWGGRIRESKNLSLEDLFLSLVE